jgi:DNA-binding response OmpR family regulator
MANFRFDAIFTLIADPDLGSRDSVRTILRNNGFRELRLGVSCADVRSALESPVPLDLLICECTLEDGDCDRLIHAMRHHEVGDNPFLPVIALSVRPTPELVRRMVDAGVDDVLPKPISTGHLLKRIQTLVEARKPFVVTSDYIGPDRRKSKDRETTVPLIEVPNVLKSKTTGQADLVGATQAVAAAVAKVNLQKLERHAVQIGVLVEMILPAYERGDIDDTLLGHLERLHDTAEDTSRRLAGTKYAHVSELCQSLISVAADIRGKWESPQDKDLKLLPPLSQAIRSGFDVKEDVAALARRISASVAEGGDRRRAKSEN